MLEAGQSIPDLEVTDDQGQRRRLRDFIGKGGLVLWFYPKDDTPG